MARSHGLGLVLCFAFLLAAANATQFRVGGQRGWSVPDANATPYNAWAGKLRFQKGDQLLFVYPKDTDSVLLVDPAAYNACNTSSYVSKFDDGNTVFTLDRSGPFFFISGNETNCRANEKLIIVVLGDHSGTMLPPSSAPLPSPSSPPEASPMPSPVSSTPPSPAPNSAPASAPTITPGSSPPPPSDLANTPSGEGGSSKATPTPPSRGGASTLVTGFVASLGAYISYAMLAI